MNLTHASWWLRHSRLCIGLLLAQQGLAQPVASGHWAAEAVIRFDGTSTLHDFGGQLPAQPFALSIVTNHWSAEADVLSGLMNTANNKRDKKMYEMFGTNDYPRIHGKVIAGPVPTQGNTNATLTLKIRDQQHDVPVTISSWSETDSNLTFHAEWELSLKQFKLKPPSVLGVVRVGDTVRLAADVTAMKPQH